MREERVLATTLDDVRNFLTRERLSLLRAIAIRRPPSIYELAKRLERDPKNVQEDLTILERHGLVSITERPRGKRSVKVLAVPYDELQLTVGIRPRVTPIGEEIAPAAIEGRRPSAAVDARQDRIYQDLLMIGEGPAAFYLDACQIMSRPDKLESSTHLVGHLVREIESALRDSLETFAFRQHVAQESDHSMGHASEIRRVAQGLGLESNDPALTAWLKLADRSYEFAPHHVAHRDALARPRPVTRDFLEWWEQIQSILLAVLSGLKDRFLEPLREIDRLLEIAQPAAKDAAFLRNNIPNNAIFLGHFFDKCKSPAWLIHLEKAGFFKTPPRDGRWPEAGYLARMARDESTAELVAQIMGGIPESENRLVRAELLEGIVNLPAKDAAVLMNRIEYWIEAETSAFILPDFGGLIRKLAAANEIASAIRLTRLLLDVKAPTRQEQPEAEDVFSSEPRIKSDLWNYEQVLKKDVPELAKAAGLRAIALLCDLLSAAIRFSLRNPEQNVPNDVSCVWRPAIEDHEQNQIPELKSLLTEAIRDTALTALRSGQVTLAQTIDLLETQTPPWRIFQRLAMYLLVETAGTPGLVEKYLLNRELFGDSDCRHEYARLLESRAGEIARKSVRDILSWIEDAPGPEEFKKGAGLWGHVLSSEDAAKARRAWQRDRLAWFGPALPDEWKARYQDLVAELGEPKHPDLSRHVSSYVGPSTPKTSDELRVMEVGALLGYLREWQPEKQFMGSSREGLARELSAIVADEPQRFALEAETFRGLHPTYVRSLINGFQTALGKKAKFKWAPVLRLCKWVMEQKDESVSKEVPYWADEDKDWSWTRGAIAHLLESALGRGAENLELVLRREVWDVLRRLTEDLEPTTARETPKEGHDRDPVHIAINSTRGTAMMGVTYYAIWLRRNFDNLRDGPALAASGFDAMPEVREVLETHLDPAVEPTRAIRSVYGMRFPWIRLVDPEWTQNNLDKILPASVERRDLWEAAWYAYLTHCPAFDDVLDTLKGKYALAVSRLAEPSVLGKKLSDFETALGNHLLTYYIRGKLEIASQDQLLAKFFANASDRGRAAALESIGRWLWQAAERKDLVSPDVIDRVKKLWDWRQAEQERANDRSIHATEAAAFVWWFRSGSFEESWALRTLKKALDVALEGDATVLRDAAYATVERLSAIAKDFPLEATECLARLLVRADRWQIGAFDKDIRNVFVEALKGSSMAAAVAREAIVGLGRRGLLQFRDLVY